MIDIVFTIFFAVMAWRLSTATRREAQIFAEFEQSKALSFFVLLFPLAPLVILFSAQLPPLGWLVAIGCFLPALISARRRINVFEVAGTDRVKLALATCWKALGTAIIGLSYVAIHIAFALTFATYAASA